MKDRSIDYVEFEVSSMDAAKAFYGAAFGWTFVDYSPTYCEFSDGRMKGGFHATSTVRTGGPLVVLYARDLARQRESIIEAGGKIVKPVFSFPGGSRFHFTDPDGHELAVWSDADADGPS